MLHRHVPLGERGRADQQARGVRSRAVRGRRGAAVLAAASLAAALQGLVPAAAPAVPVAGDDASYTVYGRAFPDPHGCTQGAPGTSPWAKGNVCAVQFLQWDETIAGLELLEQRFGRYMRVLSGEELREVAPGLTGEELESAGLPREDLTRDKRPLVVVKLTDSQSPVPESQRTHFVFSGGMHGIERAGIEGGIRALEDLVTWTACEADGAAAPACAQEGPFPKRILEPTDSGPTAGEVLRNGVVYFTLSNPDGWQRGELTEGGPFFQRFNGNGMDLNRDWPTIGYTEAQYTPWSEPESRGFGKFLDAVRARTASGRFAGGIDLHGMLTARSFSFTLLGAGERDYRKNQLTVDTGITTFRDSEERLTWSPLIARAGACPGELEEPVFGGNVPMCSDQWGTVWDTINYQVTGSMGDWIDSPLGLDGVGIDNEMALSHLTPNNLFDPQIEQLHVDGNKGLMYAQITTLLDPQEPRFTPGGKVAYVLDPDRIRNAGGDPAQGAPDGQDLPPQAGFERTEVAGEGVEFDVQGPDDGVRNGGLTIEATSTNVEGVSPNALVSFILDYCGPALAPGDPDNECREVARYFNQSGLYLQAGARIDLNDPPPGPYRIRPNGERTFPVRYRVSFSEARAYPIPDQEPYDVSRMDFFADLNRYTASGDRLTPISVKDVLRGPSVLDRYDTVVVANEFMPGYDGGSGSYSQREYRRYAEALARFARGGGNLTLTDAALAGLPVLGTGLQPSEVEGGVFYAGWMDFDDGQGPTYDRRPLAKSVNKEGTAEGQDVVDGQEFDNRHQTYEPTPLGYYVSPSGSANSSCGDDRCDSPNWIVAQDAWERVGGTTAARTLVRATPEPSSESSTGTSLGELKLGSGVIRIAGALLPDPSEANFHPYGLSSYALTYTGYQLIENLLAWNRP